MPKSETEVAPSAPSKTPGALVALATSMMGRAFENEVDAATAVLQEHGLLPEGPHVRSLQFANFQADAPGCDNCGAITVRNGNCYLCHNCGNSMGCS
jgi:hypothetical protein